MIVVADAGPLIALARVDRLGLLRALYGRVCIPPAVRDELQPNSERPGAQRLQQALHESWLEVRTLSETSDRTLLTLVLDIGEVEAILLAEQVSCRFLLIDDRKGRRIARQRGLPVVGMAGVLLAAKTRQLLPEVQPVLDELSAVGYRLSPALIERVLALAGETPS